MLLPFVSPLFLDSKKGNSKESVRLKILENDTVTCSEIHSDTSIAYNLSEISETYSRCLSLNGNMG